MSEKTEAPKVKLEVGVKSFQRISEAKLVFETGITGITGTTNAGKTAIFRAIRCLLENPATGKSKIRYGDKAAVVALRLNDEKPVVWQRKPASAAYKVGEEVFDKCGRSRLHDLYPTFTLGQDGATAFHFHGENQTLFPFGCTSSELFKVLEQMYCIDDAASVVEAVNDDLRQNAKEQAIAQANSQKSNKKAELISSLLSTPSFALPSLTALLSSLTSFLDEVPSLKSDLSEGISRKNTIQILNNYTPRSRFGWLAGIPDPHQDDPSHNHRRTPDDRHTPIPLPRNTVGLKQAPPACSNTEHFGNGETGIVPDPTDTPANRTRLSAIRGLETLRRDARKARGLRTSIAGLAGVAPRRFDAAPVTRLKSLREAVSTARRLEASAKRYRGELEPLKRTVDPGALGRVKTLREAVGQARALVQSGKERAALLEAATRARDEAKAALDAVEVCPLCGSTLHGGRCSAS